MDPLDSGDPAIKAWAEFRVSFASAFFLAWLASDFDQLKPYFDELREAIGNADLYGPLLKEEAERAGQTWDGEVPILRDSITWYVPVAEALVFQDMLFAEGTTAVDHEWTLHGFAGIALHSALEAYCGALGVSLERISLPNAIGKFLSGSGNPGSLTLAQWDALRDCDATRHVFVHNRGLVDEGYIRAVPGTTLLSGERRPLSTAEIFRFAHAIWVAAEAMRAAA
jgi:hypothetical protein